MKSQKGKRKTKACENTSPRSIYTVNTETLNSKTYKQLVKEYLMESMKRDT